MILFRQNSSSRAEIIVFLLPDIPILTVRLHDQRTFAAVQEVCFRQQPAHGGVKILHILDQVRHKDQLRAYRRRELRRNGVDVTVDNSSERIGYKIRKAQMEKVPYMLVLGAKEAEEGNVSVRSRYLGDEGVKPLADFVNDLCEEIRTKAIRKIEKKDDEKKA